MTTRPDFERSVTAWLNAAAGEGTPDYLEEIETRVAVVRQRAWWSSPERWLPMDLTARATTFPRPSLGRALVVALLIALVTAALLIVGSRQRVPPPFGLARNGATFSWQNGDIMLAESEQATAHPIVAGATTDLAPLVSRDGTKLAFFRQVSEHLWKLMLAGVDGANVHEVLAGPLTDSDWFEWSAQDDRLAIVSTVDGARALSIVDVAKGSMTTLTVNGLQVDNDVYWMPPTGDRLVFTARPNPGQDGPVAIYTIRPDGSGLTTLAPIRAEIASYNDLGVSQDGRTISYWNYEPDGSIVGMGARIHLLDVATGQDRVMKFDPKAAGETDLAFSPDGVHVVLQREALDRARLMIATLDGSEPGRLVGPSFAVDASPGYGFSPDGRQVFLSFENQRPVFFGVEDRTQRQGPDIVQGFGGYQRLAP